MDSQENLSDAERVLWRRLEFAVLVLATGLRLWDLSRLGYLDPYYAATVRTAMGGGVNFWLGSFDPGGFVTADKPPPGFWLQAAFAHVLGFGTLGLTLPHALCGVLTVFALGRLVARRFSPPAGVFAALALALTPIAVAVERTNLLEAPLTLALVLSADQIFRTIETGRMRHLLGAAALAALGFHLKLATVLIPLPGFALAALIGMPGTLAVRVGKIAAATVVLVALSSIWIVVMDALPPASRPYIGSSRTNRALDTALVFYGPQRLLNIGAISSVAPSTPLYNTDPHPLRLLRQAVADQIFWWLPLMLFGGVTAARRRPSLPDALVWGLWVIGFTFLFGIVRNVFHPYYLEVLGPGAAALIGIGAAELWFLKARWSTLLFATTGLWQAWLALAYPSWAIFLVPVALAGGAISSVRGGRVLASLLLCVAPFAWCLSATLTRCNSPLVYAGPLRFTQEGPDPQLTHAPSLWQGGLHDADQPRLISYLKRQRRGERFLLATLSSIPAAPLIIKTGEAVMAMGGFGGSDPILTPEHLEERIQAGEVRFFLLPRYDPPLAHGADLAAWIRLHGRAVDPSLWRDPGKDVMLYEISPS